MDFLEHLISERPSFHASETEILRSFELGESFLPEQVAQEIFASGLKCYGLAAEVLRFLFETIDDQSRTLETGAGCSTLVFALRRAVHTAVTPSADEIQRIRAYAEDHGIGLDSVRFVAEPSENYLPHCDLADLDMVLVDGKHAFPWPIMDWFFTADKLKRGGLLLLDDAKMRSVSVLSDFLSADPGWEMVRNFSGKTLVFRKARDRVLDVAWHMQPWTVNPPGKLIDRIRSFSRRGVLGWRI